MFTARYGLIPYIKQIAFRLEQFNRNGGYFVGVKRAGPEVDHCSSSSVEVGNECSFVPTPCMAWAWTTLALRFACVQCDPFLLSFFRSYVLILYTFPYFYFLYLHVNFTRYSSARLFIYLFFIALDHPS